MPDWKRIGRERISSLRLDGAAESELAEELSQHLEDRYRELRAGGASEGAAFQQTLSELDDVYRLEAQVERNQRIPIRDTVPVGDPSMANFISEVWRDVRYTGRILRKSPLFVLFVVLTLALGIAANSTVFTVINTLILNPVPVRKPSELAAVGTAEMKSRSKSSATLPVSYANLKDYRARNEVFTSLAGYTAPGIVTLQRPGATERMFSELVTGDYFSTLGLQAAKGRFFLPEEDGPPGAHAVAVMNFATWQGVLEVRPKLSDRRSGSTILRSQSKALLRQDSSALMQSSGPTYGYRLQWQNNYGPTKCAAL
jgi:hypothetical protein